MAIDRPIEHGPRPTTKEHLIVRTTDACDKTVRVVRGFADHRQNATGAGFDGDNRTASVAECRISRNLEITVDLQPQTHSCLRVINIKFIADASIGVDFDLLVTDLTMQ